ncbi:hypothetical protein [Belnapia rosea]|uniref:hypothetical protein n=1 Tax=Belnapia rosea TaxID=938405 RepID=UPI000890392A|nr:hypothetical protein [Belnapia rosea]SDB22552.1 hypothetical protein SAMN02927895_00902 [Belnapia rosea]
MRPDAAWVPNGLMDPWCLVELADGTETLFGFAVEHSGTGGLSWVLSTPIVWLDAAAQQAETASGRRYALGREVTADTLPTIEARIAFAFLVSPHSPAAIPLPPVKGDLFTAAMWVSACKMARHLRLEAPPLEDSAAVIHFLETNIEQYRMLRDGRSPS